MIYIGLDDTDVEGSPGTNQLALTLAAQLADRYEGHFSSKPTMC